MFDHSAAYVPKDGPGGCGGSSAKSTFHKFFAWNCENGAEAVVIGHVRYENSSAIFVDLSSQCVCSNWLVGGRKPMPGQMVLI